MRREATTTSGDAREYDPRLEALLPLLRREVPALIHADRMAEIEEALSIAEDYGLRLVVTGGVEAHRLADRLAAAGVGVILGNSGSYASDIRGGRRGLERRGARHPEPGRRQGGVLRSGGLAASLADRAPRG